MPRIRPRCLRVAPALLSGLLLWSLEAHAGFDPAPIYVFPSALEFVPDQASATRLVLHGTFIIEGANGPRDPVCGKMYFACPMGSEPACRRQWNEIASAIGTAFCEGFGSDQAPQPPTLLTEAAALGAPDTWALGNGIFPDDYVHKYCAVARFKTCPPPAPGDLGVVQYDFALVKDLAYSVDFTSPTDVAAPQDHGASTDAGAAVDASASLPVDPVSPTSSCSIGGRSAPCEGLLFIALGLVATLVLRRGRPGGGGPHLGSPRTSDPPSSSWTTVASAGHASPRPDA